MYVYQLLSLSFMQDAQRPLLLAYIKYGCGWKLKTKFIPQALLTTSTWAFIRGIGTYEISVCLSDVKLIRGSVKNN